MPERRGPGPRGPLGHALTLAVPLALLAGVYLLPPDTTLSELRRAGVLRACVPDAMPPLVTGEPERPGYEVEVLERLAEEMGVRLLLSRNSAIGASVNPRNWRLTRAQCVIIAGGVLATPTTRSYIDTTAPHLAIGWAAIHPEGRVGLDGAHVGFHAGLSGFDRLELSRTLRGAGASVSLVASAEALGEGLRTGRFDVAVTDSLAAARLAPAEGHDLSWLSPDLEPLGVAFGLWKGDLSLKRRVVAILEEMRADGTLEALRESYGIEAPDGALLGPESAATATGPATRDGKDGPHADDA
jgi:polar amino acid transport system substrate-binding protein/cystine transport system substrate-binding protein/membrane-bound lytic murein transglycosylase F